MADDKVRFELHASINHAETWFQDKPLKVGPDGYESSDPAEIAVLDNLYGVKRVAKAAAKDKG